MKRIIPIVFALAALAGCSRSVPDWQAKWNAEALSLQDSAMLIHDKEPERALSMIDSAEAIGSTSPYMADFLRAKIYAQSNSIDIDKDTALVMLKSLLDNDSTKIAGQAGIDRRIEVLSLLTGTCRHREDYIDYLNYASQLSDLYKLNGSKADALRTDADLGYIMTIIGRRDEGVQLIDNAISSLKGDKSMDRLDAFIVSSKRKIFVLNDEGDYEGVINLAKDIIAEIDRYESSPSEYAEDNYRLPPIGLDRKRWSNFYRAQAQCYAANAHSLSKPAQTDSAAKYIRLFRASDYGKTVNGRWMAIPASAALGDWDEVNSLLDIIESQNTVNPSPSRYSRILYYRALEANAGGRVKEAYELMREHAELSEKLNREESDEDLRKLSAEYSAKENEFKLRQAENASRTQSIILALMLIAGILSLSFTLRFRKQRISLEEKNKVLAKVIEKYSETMNIEPQEEDTANESAADEEDDAPAGGPDQELFARIDGVIRSEKLYANKLLQRQDIIDRFGISRHALNDLFNNYANGQSFPGYINSIRLQEALFMLKNEPGMSITAIAEAVGFTPANLREQFKCRFGMTPAEYRQSI